MTDQQVEAPAPTLVLVPDAAVTEEVAPEAVVHKVKLSERGPFVVAVCDGCGWETFARRSRPLARREGRDHEILHSPS
jgi:hypothetical protein